MTSHPNATAAALTTPAIGFVIWALHRYAGVNLSIRQALSLLGGTISVVLWIGRVGLKGAWLRIWHGASAVVNGSRPPAPPADPPA